MKKILSLILVLTLALACFVACGNETPEVTEKSYALALAVDTTIAANNKVTNTALMLVLDADNKIVAARIDCAEATPAPDDAGAIAVQENISSKVEQGDNYGNGYSMPAGSWADQAKAFENWLVGKTADEVAGTEFTNELIAGCTMTSSMTTFKALVAEAFASELKVEFKTAEALTAGIALSTNVSNNKVTTDVASLVIAGDKVAATAIDSIEQKFSVAEGAIVAGELAASKNEQGENYGNGYSMPAGAWYKQAQAFSASTVGKTAAELENLETVSDALEAAGCTMQNTTAGYKATIIKAAGYAK